MRSCWLWRPRAQPRRLAACRRRAALAAAAGGAEGRRPFAPAACSPPIISPAAADWLAQRVLDLYRRRWQAELAFMARGSPFDSLEALRAFDSELVSA